MSEHERFQELSALAVIGQLSSDEDRELNEHLRECADCRERHGDYSHIVVNQLPNIRWRTWANASMVAPDTDLRDQFLARARAEKMHVPADVNARRGTPLSPFRWTRLWSPAIALAGFALVTCVAILVWRTQEPIPLSNGSSVALIQQAGELKKLRVEVEVLRQAAASDSAELALLKKSRWLTDRSQRDLQGQLEKAMTEEKNLSSELQEAKSNNLDLLTSSQQKDVAIANIQAQGDKMTGQRADDLSQMVFQQLRIRELTKSLDEAQMGLERESQLMAVSKDVRQLMGARNLHIIDVHDVDANSKSAKSFGRVFYAEGQSLIFYAFDLRNGLSSTKYTFYAWGQRNSSPQASRNLGSFGVDDYDQHRWVLKINDPSLLAGIDSVFVTAESIGEAKEPRGKRLLYAYIAGRPNHP